MQFIIKWLARREAVRKEVLSKVGLSVEFLDITPVRHRRMTLYNFDTINQAFLAKEFQDGVRLINALRGPDGTAYHINIHDLRGT